MRPIDADALQQMIDVAEERFEKEPAKAGHGRKYFNCNGLRYFIDKFPTLDVAPVIHACWNDGPGYSVEILRDWYLQPTYVCSSCKTEEDKKTNYCPHCGAKMDGENDESD